METILEKLIVSQLVKNSLSFIGPKDSVAYSQETAINLYPEPDDSGPHTPALYLRFILIL
jgi:hypothetical protein